MPALRHEHDAAVHHQPAEVLEVWSGGEEVMSEDPGESSAEEQRGARHQGSPLRLDEGIAIRGDLPESPAVPEPDRSEVDSERAVGRWTSYAWGAGALVVTAGVAVVATLAATRQTARSENARAYAHGVSDTLDALASGLLGDEFIDEIYC
jgi:hypothetical protein